MASAVGNLVKLNNGQIITPQQGGWYDAQQYFNGSLSNPGQIHPQSTQQGAGQNVSNEVMAQTNPKNVPYVQQQQQQAGVPTNDQAGGGNPGGGGVGGGGMPQGGGGAGLGVQAAPPIDLQAIYQNSSGGQIKGLQDELSQKENDYITAQGQINDNPWISEAQRTGRLQKLSTDFEARTANLRNDITNSKAEADRQVGIAQKQYDINNQATQQSISQFNSLLSSGALNNASADDIANLTRATGMSSSMIQSAIKASSTKNTKTQVIPFDDGTDQGYVVINPETGQIISKQTIAGSKILGTALDKPLGKGTGGNTKVTAADNKVQALQQLPQDFKNKMTLGTAMSFYEQYGLTKQQIYDQYRNNGQYNPTSAQVAADKKRYNVK